MLFRFMPSPPDRWARPSQHAITSAFEPTRMGPLRVARDRTDDSGGVPAAAWVRPAPTPMQTTDEHDGSPAEKAADANPAEEREEQFRTLAESIPGVATFLDRIVEDPGHSI